MLVLGPSQNIERMASTKLMLVPIGFNGEVEIYDDKDLCVINPRRANLNDLQPVEIFVKPLRQGEYTITARAINDPLISASTTIKFSGWLEEGVTTSGEIVDWIVKTLEGIDVSPRFNRIQADLNGNFEVTQSRQFAIDIASQDYGDIVGTIDLNVRVIVGYLGNMIPEDFNIIEKEFYSNPLPKGVIGAKIDSVTFQPFPEGQGMLGEYNIYVSYWRF